MLIRYTVENFLSFYQNIEFAMIAGKTRKFPEHVVKGKNIELLKTGVIYGANASGKSNLITSLDFAQQIVLSGLRNVNSFNKHFRLSKESIDLPTKFEFEIKCGDKYYAYGFAVILKVKKIVEEWLYEIGKKETMIFERKEQENGEHHVKLNIPFKNKAAKQRFEVYVEDMKTMTQQLFLTEISHKQIAQIKEITPFQEVFHWFENILTIIFPDSTLEGIPFLGSDEQMKDVFCKLLEYFDTGIKGMTTNEYDLETALKDAPKDLKTTVAEEDGNVLVKSPSGSQYAFFKNKSGELKAITLGLKHRNSDNIDAIFELKDESDGTQRLFDLIPALYGLLTGSKVFVIDELDRSLHPALTRKFVALFLELVGEKESQLIVSTHESSLLDLKLLRRDEIWFVEKDEKNASTLYSLDVFQERYDKEIRKGYLLGRYGAIPVFKQLAEIS